MVGAIHQLVAGFSRGDAISNECIKLRALFRSWGRNGEIFCELKRILPELRREARDLETAPSVCQADDIVLLHLSIGSPANELFPRLPGRKCLLYHNITPPEYFRLIEPRIARDLELGREQARRLAGVAAVNLADSRFNAEELKSMGYLDPIGVFPLALDFDQLAEPPDRGVLRAMSDGRVNILFVGRGAPNKRIEDVLTAFAFFQRHVEPHSRLIHVGSYAGTERYRYLLSSMARDMRVETLLFTGAVPQAALNAYYRSAHVFLCLSAHEGFCIPLIESMFHGVPVLATRAGAMPETLNGAGVLVNERRFEYIAEMMGHLARPGPFREQVLARQHARLEQFMRRNVEAELRAFLAPLL